VIDSKIVYTSRDFTVKVVLTEDTDTHPDEFGCYSDDDMVAWKSDQWRYVDVTATVTANGHTIGENTLSGVEHGTLGDGTEVDALNVTVPDSAALNVVYEALCDARDTLTPRALDTVFDFFGMAVPQETTPPNADAVSAARLIMHTHPQALPGALVALRAMGVAEPIIVLAEAREREILQAMFNRTMDKLEADSARKVSVMVHSDGEVTAEAPNDVTVEISYPMADDDRECEGCGLPCYREDNVGTWVHREGFGYGDDHPPRISD
jgi:hypothetical protein